MNRTRTWAAAAVFALSVARLSAQGPPFQIDDPVPVDLDHYEFYIFGSMDADAGRSRFHRAGVRVQLGRDPPSADSRNPAVGRDCSVEQSDYFPGGTGTAALGLIDSELGTKIAFFKETKHIPQIGTFTMFEIPIGSYPRGLGVGKVWYKLPIWLQKNIGHWLLDGGAGYTVVPQTGYRNFLYGGFLLKYAFGERLEIGGEVFSHGSEGFAAPQTQASTMIDIGGYYHLKHHPGEQFLLCYARGSAPQSRRAEADAGRRAAGPDHRARRGRRGRGDRSRSEGRPAARHAERRRAMNGSLSPATSGFVLAAAVTVLFNTALAWAKDSYAPLNTFLASLAGHHWTTHGLLDLILFAGLGLVFTSTRIAEKIPPQQLTGILIGAVVAASLGLALCYVFV